MKQHTQHTSLKNNVTATQQTTQQSTQQSTQQTTQQITPKITDQIGDQAADWYQVWSKFLAHHAKFQHDHMQSDTVAECLKQLAIALENGDSALDLSRDDRSIAKHALADLGAFCAEYQGQKIVNYPLVWDAPFLYMQRYWALEYQLAQDIKRLLAEPVATYEVTQFLGLFEGNVKQQQALQLGVNNRFAMISGGPGTGKTYTLSRIVAVLKKFDSSLRIAMAAPTGKAAQRMTEALNQAFSSPMLHQADLYHADFAQQSAQTLHRLLGLGYQRGPKYHAEQPLPYDVVVVDEASMLDLHLAQMLFAALPAQCRLILLGDADQLSSVDVGQVLADLMRVQALAPYQIKLTESQRFASNAQIGQFAQFIYHTHHNADPGALLKAWYEQVKPYPITVEDREHLTLQFAHEAQSSQNAAIDRVNYQILLDSYLTQHHQLNLIYDQLAAGYQDYVALLQDYQDRLISAPEQIDQELYAALSACFDRYRILVAIRGGALGLYSINREISQRIRSQVSPDSGEWYIGRAVMMVYNDPNLGLSNGDIGICIRENNAYAVYFASLGRCIAAARLPQSVQTAFALTIHKSQGSEFRHVAVVLDNAAQRLLSQELIYTAITRAKKMVTLYAPDTALAASLITPTTRVSGLTQQVERTLALDP